MAHIQFHYRSGLDNLLVFNNACGQTFSKQVSHLVAGEISEPDFLIEPNKATLSHKAPADRDQVSQHVEEGTRLAVRA